MNARRIGAIGAAVALGIGLSACGSDDGGETGTGSGGDSTTSGKKLKIGIKFDQPGLGLKSGNTYSGFDVLTAVYIAKSMGVPASNITWVEADPADREKLLADGKVDLSGIWIKDTPGLLDYFYDLAKGLPPGDVVMTPWAQAIARQRESRD